MWKKGQSGNPNGRPRKERGLTDELRKQLELRWSDSGRTNRELLVSQLLVVALTGSLDAMKYIFDRFEGRPAQSLEHTGEGGSPIVIKFLKGPDGNG